MGDMRIMLVDDNGDLRRGMRDYLARQEGIKVVAECPSGAEALEALGKVRVDVMVLDLIMPQMDGFALMEEVRRQQLANPPQIIVVSALGRDDFIMRAVQLGARFYMVKPFDMASLAARIRESCGQGVVPLGTALNASARSLSIDEKLASLFLTIGIPAHIKGYQFLRTAVKMVVDNPDMINRITKELYPSIGKCYNTSASKVERAIRHAIEVAWSRGRIDTLNKLRKNGNYSCGLALRLLSFVICMTSRFIERCWSSSSWRKMRMRRSSASVRFVGMSSPAAGS